MYCDNCKERPATVHITQIHNDKKVEMHLCEACAAKKGTYEMNWGQGLTEGFTLPNLLSGFFGGAMPLVNGPVDTQPSPTSCPDCGMSFHQFTQTGRLGCGQCYDSYASQIEPILRRIHGNTRHLGRVPARSGEKVRLQKTIKDLKKELQDAVSREEYEQAAELRDRIKALERKKEMEERG
ncbi:MAG: hypothetical protein GX964_09025 [Syntrophomonadaceae bacterium]|nr:hypothetical protein [Syntrophomonadaceae bacterium]